MIWFSKWWCCDRMMGYDLVLHKGKGENFAS